MSVRPRMEDLIDKKFIGIPYVEHGRDFSGVDCLGLILLWYKQYGIVFEEGETKEGKISSFWWNGDPKRYIEGINTYGETFPFNEVRKNDIVLFFTRGGNHSMPTNAGVMIDGRHFLWISEKTIMSEVRMLDATLKERFWGALRPRRIKEAGL